MSRENVDVVRRWFEALNRGGWDAPDLISDFWDPAGDYYPVRKFPEARPRHGIDEISEFFAQISDAWSRVVAEIEDLTEVGDDRILVRAALQSEGRGSGLNLEGNLYYCFWLRHGRFFRVEDHLTLAGALHAFGFEAETLEAIGLRPNVEIVRGIYDAVARRDAVAPFELYADDIVFDLSAARRSNLMTKPVYHGHEGFRQAWRESLSVFGEVDFEVPELIPVGDKVLGVVLEHVVGRTSGAPVDTTHFAVWTLAGGKVTRLQVFDDRTEAERAAGLAD
jgi:ketosteroid isomerase-like protein